MFVRSLSIGAETMAMWFDPEKPMHDRYQVRHDFLSGPLGDEIVTISRLVNAFFRWEFNSCETIVKDGDRVSDRLCERLARRRADLTALLLPLGDRRTRALERVLRGHATRDADQPELARLLRVG